MTAIRSARWLAVLTLAAFPVMVVADEMPPLKATTKKADDTVEVKAEKGVVTLTIRSPSGISQAVIERTGDKWPDWIVLRLRLTGLESFQISGGRVKVHGSVSSTGRKPQTVLWADGKEDTPLDSKSPLWTEVKIVGADGKPTEVVPVKDGYFEMALPKALFEGDPKSITVHWIDFFRR